MCPRCERELPLASFAEYSKSVDGREKNCRGCRKSPAKNMDRAWYLERSQRWEQSEQAEADRLKAERIAVDGRDVFVEPLKWVAPEGAPGRMTQAEFRARYGCETLIDWDEVARMEANLAKS